MCDLFPLCLCLHQTPIPADNFKKCNTINPAKSGIGQHFHNCQHVQYIVNLHFAFDKLYNPTDEYNNISAFISNLIIDNSRILHTTNSRTPNFLLLLEAIYIKYHSLSLNSGLKASKELNLFSWHTPTFYHTSHCTCRGFNWCFRFYDIIMACQLVYNTLYIL